MEGRRRWLQILHDELALTKILPAHPEHYGLPGYREGSIETIGGHVVRLQLIQANTRCPTFSGIW